MSEMDDARATVRFAIFNALVGENFPRAAHDYLERAAEVAAEAVADPSTAWAFEMVASAAKPEINRG